MILYQNLGKQKRICDIIFAGAHDASITSGAKNVQTQHRGRLLDQMKAGVRLFDLRILAHKTPDGHVVPKGYHGKKAGEDHSSRTYAPTQKRFPDLVTHSHMSKLGGGFGLGLKDMLDDAVTFLDGEGEGEFLILKFDKCTNYDLIAEMCVHVLGSHMYTAGSTSEFSKNTLDDLAGKVVCIFHKDGVAELAAKGLGPGDGILGFRRLNGAEGVAGYLSDYPGLQFIGKGGTDPHAVFSTGKQKRKENFKTQSALMSLAEALDPSSAGKVLGMMYWTATGLTESIKARDRALWTRTGVRSMETLWNEALQKAIEVQVQSNKLRARTYGLKRQMKAFIPNIIMIDFADTARCQTIYDLNLAAEQRLVEAVDEWDELHGVS